MVLSNKYRTGLALFALATMTVASATPASSPFGAQAKPGEAVVVILTKVKAGKQEQFEDYLRKFGVALSKASQTDPMTKRVEAQTRTLVPVKPNPDGTFTYVFLADPVVSDPNAYEMGAILKKVLPESEAEKLMKQFEDAVSSQEFMEFTQWSK